MATNYNPRTVTDDLTLCLDAGNIRGYDKYENLLTYSEDFSNVIYGVGNISVSTNAITAPDGNTTADAFIENTTSNAYHFINQFITKAASSITYTFSIFVKSKGGRRIGLRIESGGAGVISEFNVVTGTNPVAAATYNSGFSSPSSSIVKYPNDWYRITLTATSNTSTSLFIQLYLVSNITNSSVYTGDGTSGVYVWGAQLERGNSLSDYYSTTTTAKNRGIILSDLSGKRYDGTLASGPTYDSSGSIVFDGTDDHIACSVIPRSTSMSLEVWFNTPSVSPARQYLYTQQRDTPVLALYAYQERQGCQLESNRAVFQYFNDVNNSFLVTTDAIIQPNTWYQFVATLNGSSYQLYLNGLPTNMNPNTINDAFVSTNPQSKTFTPNEAFIARRADGQGEDRFTGKIAIVKEYSRALTAEEVRQNFNALRNRFGI